MNTITTDRLVIRNFISDDAKDYYEFMSKPQVNCFSEDRIFSIDEANQKIIEKIGDDLQGAVCLLNSNKVIGHVFGSFDEPDVYSICWNFHPDFCGLGYAFEAANVYLDYLFETKKARRVYAYVEDYNCSSQNLCIKLGMRLEGEFVDFITFVKDEYGADFYETTRQYAILRREWERMN